MSKRLFRFLRGELNGYYLQKINEMFLNAFADGEQFLAEFSAMQFKSADDVKGNEFPILAKDLFSIGTVAGVFPPYVPQDSLIGSLRFTKSHKVNGIEYSDRGLFSVDTNNFDFVRTNQQQYTTDINTLASKDRMTSVVETGAKLLGFFQEGDKVITEEGTVDLSLLKKFSGTMEQQYALAEAYFKSINKAYSPYYGPAYMYFAEKSPIIAKTSNDVFLELIKAMQYVRYNGVSVASLCKLVQVLCPNYLFILSIDWSKGSNHAVVTFGIDEDYEANDKLMRTEVFKVMVAMKFKQYLFRENTIKVTRDEQGNVIEITDIGRQ